MISKRTVKEIVKAITNKQISKSAVKFIQASNERFLQMLIEMAVNEQESMNGRLKVCNLPIERRLNLPHFRNAERKLLREEENV